MRPPTSTGVRLSLPLTAYRADPAVSVGGEAILAWTEKFSLIKASRMKKIMLTTSVGEFADHAYPFAGRDERLLADCWCLWTLLVDEFFEERLEARRLRDRVLDSTVPQDVLRAADSEGCETLGGLCEALDDLCDRTGTDMPDAWRSRFLAHVARFVAACHTESVQRLLRRPPATLTEFTELRRGSFATDLFLDLVEKFEHLPGAFDPPCAGLRQEIRDCAADIGGWCNDVLSFRREAAGEESANLVLFLAADRGAEPDEALDAAVVMIRERAWRLLDLKAAQIGLLRGVGDGAAAAAMRWVNAVEALVSGSLEFQLISARWQQPRPSAAEAETRGGR